VAASSGKALRPISSKARIETPWATNLTYEVGSKIVETRKLSKAFSYRARFASRPSAEIVVGLTVRTILFLGDLSTFATLLALIAVLIALRIRSRLNSGVIAPFSIRATT
jgi:hypothetical protein